jgi:hypothetical protein
LCEQAEALLINLAEQYDIKWVSMEIADDATLLELYEVKIPVLKNTASNVEISWPFNRENIEKSFLI